ncbi:MAG TPA: DEAD/DEAH box helicase [Firmicutes bacterium]|nr:DEAD/DEAH box helicase [Bacillota bacterium]
MKNLEITYSHFQDFYAKEPCRYFVYDPGNISNLRSFAVSDSIQIMVINIDSFAKDENIINKVTDKLTGRKPIEFIRGVNPIVIVDEPQNMETPIRKQAIESLNPLCTLRYSATHKNLYNLVHSLNPVRAYDMGLVKQIEVDSVYTENDHNRAYVGLKALKAAKTKITAKLEIDVLDKGVTVRKFVSAGVGADLYELSGKRDFYKDGFIVERIDMADGYVEFTNGVKIFKGESRGGLTDEVMKVQVEKTIEEHFKKELKYRKLGIKVLSLFFIDRVANYRGEDGEKGKFAIWFEELFKKYAAKKEFKDIIPFKTGQVHNGYFAQDKKGILKDSSEGRDTKADDEVYHLIMKDKERLLDTNEPLRFIFSHSALREGWDNPNVFQICTLNETKSELKKRQEIGRGLRLCVNSEGVRNFEKTVNRLTVIANESYNEFAAKLQKEIEDDCGVSFEGRVKDKRRRAEIKLRKGFQFDKNFMELWDRIKSRTTYRVDYSTDELIQKASDAVREMPRITRPVVKSVKTDVVMLKEGITGKTLNSGMHYTDTENMQIPDIYSYMEDRVHITRSSIYRILYESGRMNEILENPQLFLDTAVSAVKKVLNSLMIDGIKYEKIGGAEYEMRLFEDAEVETYIDNLYEVKNSNKTLTDYVETVSKPEEQFAKDCDSREDVEFYIKLPRWFKINTPIGPYNPDWALIMKNEKKIYFVAETKSELDPEKRRPEENDKITCGQAHFKEFEEVEYKVVRNVEELKR